MQIGNMKETFIKRSYRCLWVYKVYVLRKSYENKVLAYE